MNRVQLTINNIKNNRLWLRVVSLCCFIFLLVISGCQDKVELLFDEEMAVIRVFIGEDSLSARTLQPVREDILGYQLTFSGAAVREPVNITEGNSTDVALPNGEWIITATAYKLGGTIGNEDDAIASGSITIRISGGVVSGSVPPIILTQSGGTGNGVLDYKVTVSSGISGFMRLLDIEGNLVNTFKDNGELAVSASVEEEFNLAAGRYIIEVRLTNEEEHIAFHRVVIEIWEGATTTFIFEPVNFFDPNMILPVMTFGHFNVESIEFPGISFLNNTLNITADGTYTISMREDLTSTTINRIVVVSGVTADITLSGVNINVSSISNAYAFDMRGATVNLTLVGENVLRSGSGRAGLEVPSGSTLEITAASTGSLTATGGSGGAGIGGGERGAGGTISITGGTITATGGSGGAGIGGGERRAGGTISITGGTVTATGGSQGSGIGGGRDGAGGTIETISGNAVIIASSIQPDLPSGENLRHAIVFDGINGTMYGNVTLARDVTIPSGRVLGIQNNQTLTIENGFSLTNEGAIIIHDGGNINELGTIAGNQPVLSSFTITVGSEYTYLGGILTITGDGTYTIGMRSGVTSTTVERIVVASGVTANITLSDVNIDVSSISNVSAFNMTGATVNLTLDGDNVLRSGGNRAGLEAPEGSTLEITAASTGTLTATGGTWSGAGIGGGERGAGGTISITGGTVTATSGISGAGIGGGERGAGGTISITGGTVIATGGLSGSGIGGGEGGAGGTISITGGTVTATGGSHGAGIGGGNRGAGGTISITGGTVTATGVIGAGIDGGSGGAGGTIETISGNAVIFASSIQPELHTVGTLGPAIVFIGNNGIMYGNVTLQQNVTFAVNRVLTISAGQTLTIPAVRTLTNNGTINNSGTINGALRIIGNAPTGGTIIP